METLVGIGIGPKLKFGLKSSAAAVAIILGLQSVSASAGTLVLEGSDAAGLHHDASYTSQLFSYLQEGSANPVVVFGSAAMSGLPPGTIYTTDLSGLSIASHSALYIQSPGGCCNQNRTGALTYETQISNFVAAGGSLAIQDYQGGDWGSILSFNAPSSVIGGYGGGAGGPTCFDTEVVTALGIARGFTQPAPSGCWGHQAYDMAYFGPLGFVNLIDSGPQFATLGSGSWSSFMAVGGTLGNPDPTGAVPEPSTWAMMLIGFGFVGGAMRSRRRQKLTVSYA